MKVYIAGPMRGKPNFNFPAFDRAAEEFKERGWEVINPADLDRDHGMTGFEEVGPPFAFIRDAIIRDCQAVAACDAIYFLPGWEESRGSQVEWALAKFLGLRIMYGGQVYE